jgi:hypothetical protein
MSALSRRGVLRATAASSALALAPAVMASPAPDPVVLLGREHDARLREVEAYWKAENIVDEEGDALCKLWFDVIERIAATPATSFAGVVVKLDIVRYDLEEGETSHTDNLAASAIADLKRMAGSSAP